MKKINHKYKIIVGIIATAFLVTGCAATKAAQDANSRTNDAIETANSKLNSAQSIANNNFNYEMDSIYISANEVQRKETEKLPAKFADQVQIDGGYTNLRQIADTLQRITGFPVLLDIEPKDTFYVRLTQNKGTLADLLNNLCAQTDTAWAFLQGKLIISDLETQTFFIKALPGDVTVQNQVNSNSGINSQSGGSGTAGQGSGGSATSQSSASNDMNTVQNVQFNVNHSIWTNISDTVKGMLSKRGAMNVAPSTSSITITDKPSNVLKVSEYIKKQNDMLRQQVQIDVQVFTIETTAADNYMVNWNMILSGSDASFAMNGMTGAAASGASSGLVPIMTPNATTQSFIVTAKSGSLSGSQIMVNAISTKTNSSLVTSAAATTLNNQPVPIQIIQQQGYVSNVSTTQVAQAGSQQSITTGQLSYGFTLNVLPTIEKNGLVNVQLSLNLSSLKALNNYATTGAMVQLPDMIQRNAMQKVTMRSGDTYVTTGFDSDFNTITNAGVGSPSFWLFGGGVTAQNNRQKVIIMISPRVVKY